MNGEATVAQKTYAFGSMTIAVRTDGILKWVLSDHLGSTSITANADGSLNSEIRYSAFGEVRYSSGTTPTNYQYTNQLNQPDIGLYYYVARFYDPVIAHFVQADTIVPGAGNPSAYDRYSYVINNPILFIDPTGHANNSAKIQCPDTECGRYNLGGSITTGTSGNGTNTSTDGGSSASNQNKNSGNQAKFILGNSKVTISIFQQTQKTGTDCGGFSLASTISVYSKHKVSGSVIERSLIVGLNKVSFLGILGPSLARGANRLDQQHIYVYEQNGTIQDLIDNVNADRATLVGWSNDSTYEILFETPLKDLTIGHWVSVVRVDVDNQYVYFFDPGAEYLQEMGY